LQGHPERLVRGEGVRWVGRSRREGSSQEEPAAERRSAAVEQERPGGTRNNPENQPGRADGVYKKEKDWARQARTGSKAGRPKRATWQVEAKRATEPAAPNNQQDQHEEVPANEKARPQLRTRTTLTTRTTPGTHTLERNPPGCSENHAGSARTATWGAWGARPPNIMTRSRKGLRPPQAHVAPDRVGEGGVEPPRPYGHTDLNRARLPFRHSPEWCERSVHGPRSGLHIALSLGPDPDTIDRGAHVRGGTHGPRAAA
jgi:hypothetical protein